MGIGKKFLALVTLGWIGNMLKNLTNQAWIFVMIGLIGLIIFFVYKSRKNKIQSPTGWNSIGGGWS